MLKKVLRDDGPVDIGPCSDVDRRDVVGWASVATADTPEHISLRPVSPLIGSTDRADMASTPRVDSYNLHSSEPGLILDKLPELVEPPGVQAATLRPTSRDPSTDSPEVFEGYPSLGAFGLSHYLPGDHMVHVSTEPCFFAGELLEMSLRALGSTALKISSEFGVPLPDFIDLFTGVVFPVAIIGEILQSQVHAERSHWIKGCFLGGVDCGCEVEDAVSEEEVRLSLEAIHSSPLIFSYSDGNLDTAFEGEYGGIYETLPAEDAFVVDHSPVRPELAELVFIPFVGFDDLADGSDGHLGAEPVLLPNPVVDELVKSPLVGEFVVVGYLGYVVTCLVERLHSSQKKSVLLLVWRELHQERELHHSMESISPYLIVIVTLRFLPPLKQRGFHGGFPMNSVRVFNREHTSS